LTAQNWHTTLGSAKHKEWFLSLFDSFPYNVKQRRVTEWLVPGRVVHLHCSFVLKPNKVKYLLVSSIVPTFTMLMINTDPPLHPPANTQVQLMVVEYPTCLTNDCHVNCYREVTHFTLDGVKQELLSDGSRMKGELLKKDRDQVVAAVKFSTWMSPIMQTLICDSLEGSPLFA
jgi:hypothetical protein